ncbi:MAG: putative phosphodiesterase [Phenylobacterium sp.]|jgi:predicted phosphodiesterase
MKVFAVSDVHIDYQENKEWISNLSATDYVDDILILAGDLTDKLSLIAECFASLSAKFFKVLYVPGNHELWVSRCKTADSIEKYKLLARVAIDNGVSMQPLHVGALSIVPLLSWYDFSFGQPGDQLKATWMDFRACSWPDDMQVGDITRYFLDQNTEHLSYQRPSANHTLISFSHFLPRIDLMPPFIPQMYRYIYPALGSDLLEKQIRVLKPDIHVYGHSHLNRNVVVDGIQYINNAFGYPSEDRIASKRLMCIYDA